MKAQLLIVIFVLFSFGKPSAYLDAKGIWDKAKESIMTGSMYFNKNYFIFDLKDYAGLVQSEAKRNAFDDKQKYLYDTYGINNYFFVVDTFDSSGESSDETIESIASSLESYISRDYGDACTNQLFF